MSVMDFMGSAGGSALTSAGQGIIQTGINAWSAQQAMEFQRNMANTSHQREVSDLRAAGLNPVLSANKGAPSPGGQTFSADIPDIAHSAVAAEQAKAGIELTNAQTQESSARSVGQNLSNELQQSTQLDNLYLKRNEVVQSSLENDTKRKMLQQLDLDIENAKSRNLALRYTLPGLYNEAKFQSKNPNQPAWDRVIGLGGQVINSAATASKMFAK